MNHKTTEQTWMNDFKDFIESGEGAAVPESITQAILSRTRQALAPSSWLVFFKLLGVHLTVGTLSLSICDQFGVNPFHSTFSLSQYFMTFGHSFCMVACGFVFIALSVALSKLLLKNEEFYVLKQNVWIQLFALSSLSLGVFMIFGTKIILSIALLWLFGAFVGGVLTTYLVTFKQAQH